MNSVAVKTAVLCFCRFAKRYEYISTECGEFSADVLASNGKELMEVEVKVSKADFNRDFSKRKHRIYARPDEPVSPYSVRDWIPNKFYFAVPEHLKDAVLEVLKGDYQKYGLMVVGEGRIDQAVTVVKKAQPLHSRPILPAVLRKILLRCTSDLCHFYMKGELESECLNKMKEFSEALTTLESQHVPE